MASFEYNASTADSLVGPRSGVCQARSPCQHDLQNECRAEPNDAPAGGWGSVRSLKTILPTNEKTPWDEWTNDYALIPKSIGETYPDIFFDDEECRWTPGGLRRPLPARQRVWKTETGKANFMTPEMLDEDPDMPGYGPDTLCMITLRSNDQFNTTIYGYDDRFRGINGTRDVVLMNQQGIARHGLVAGAKVRVETVSKDSILRERGGLTVVPYGIPPGCAGACYRLGLTGMSSGLPQAMHVRLPPFVGLLHRGRVMQA